MLRTSHSALHAADMRVARPLLHMCLSLPQPNPCRVYGRLHGCLNVHGPDVHGCMRVEVCDLTLVRCNSDDVHTHSLAPSSTGSHQRYFDQARTGDLISRLSGDVSALVQPIQTMIGTVISSSIQLSGGIFMCFHTCWRLSMLAFVTVAPMMYLTDQCEHSSPTMLWVEWMVLAVMVVCIP